MFLLWTAAAAVGSLAAAYCSVLAFVYFQQRALLYLPRRRVVAPSAAGLAGAQDRRIKTRDGETLVAWHVAPQAGGPLLLYFQGNASCLADIAPRLRRLCRNGLGLLAIDYRGFGGSSGRPTEAGLACDADAAYGAALALGYAPDDIVVVGEALGAAVAVALAVRHRVAGVVLEAPFPSAMALAAHRYPFLPVRLAMQDRFRTDRAIHELTTPLLIVHGTADTAVPLRYGRMLFRLAPSAKTFIEVPARGHRVLQLPGVIAQVETWIGTLPRAPVQ